MNTTEGSAFFFCCQRVREGGREGDVESKDTNCPARVLLLRRSGFGARGCPDTLEESDPWAGLGRGGEGEADPSHGRGEGGCGRGREGGREGWHARGYLVFVCLEPLLFFRLPVARWFPSRGGQAPLFDLVLSFLFIDLLIDLVN